MDNSVHGAARDGCVFEYRQSENLVTANYRGGGIRHGSIVGLIDQNQVSMRYCCMNENNEMRSGKAIALVLFAANGKLVLTLEWQWLDAGMESGQSRYQEL